MSTKVNSTTILEGADKSWHNFLNPQVLSEVEEILTKVYNPEKQTTPTVEKALRFFQLPLDKIKVIILGQDPYPQEGVATGRSFEVGTLKTWSEPFRNISLKNIIRSIYAAYNNETLKYNDIKAIIDKDFHILPPDELFKNWEKQGVLLLNTSFSCEIGSPGSHAELWNKFTLQLLNFIAKENPKITWFIWGNHAQKAIEGIPVKNKIESMHPMMCYDKPGRDNDFLFGKVNPFKETKSKINWLGK